MLKSRRAALATHKERWIRRLSACVVTGFLLGSAAAVTIGSGWSSAPRPVEPPKPCDTQIVTLDIYAAGNVNPNESGNPRPVVVRLYQLSSDLNHAFRDVYGEQAYTEAIEEKDRKESERRTGGSNPGVGF